MSPGKGLLSPATSGAVAHMLQAMMSELSFLRQDEKLRPTNRASHVLPNFGVRNLKIEMKITVEIPTALRRFTDGVQSIECSWGTLPELLGEIKQGFPA